MIRFFLAISVMGLANQAFADLKLHSVVCSSKSLTLNIAMVANDEVAEENTPNAKGVLLFKAKDNDGIKILGERSKEFQANLGLQYWPKGYFLLSYFKDEKNKNKIDLNIQTRSDLATYLHQNKPLLYSYSSDARELDGEFSYVKNQRIIWNSCQLEVDNSMDIRTEATISNFPIHILSQAVNCPAANSNAEKKMITGEASIYLETGKKDFCFNRTLNRYLSRTGKSTASMNSEELKKYVEKLLRR